MTGRGKAIPPDWEPRLAHDLAELVEAAATLAADGRMQELPADFEALLAALATQAKPR
jgi:hypothetical protein